MLTPQQIDNISFSRATFGGYDMQSVDEFLEPLTEDYITLYKENALLKSKMKVLVAKLEEYRSNEANIKEAAEAAQKTCDGMIRETEEKCTQMLAEANAAAIESAKNADAAVAAEEARVAAAQKTACEKINTILEQLDACMQALAYIKTENTNAEEEDNLSSAEIEAVADEISANLEARIGTTGDPASPADSQQSANKLPELQFGPNYDPTKS